MKKAILLIIFFTVSSFVFSGCFKCDGKKKGKTTSGTGTGTSTTTTVVEQPVIGDWFMNSLDGSPDYLNPILSTTRNASYIENLVFDYLFDITKDLDLIPRLAESYEISDDKLVYTFKVREGVKWHDDVPLTAEDFVYTYQKIIDPKVKSMGLRESFENVKEVTLIDTYTFKVVYNQPDVTAIMSWSIAPIPKHIYEKEELKEGGINESYYNRHPIGCGPYKFVEWQTDQHILLERNPNYWDNNHPPYLEKIKFKIIPDQSVEFLAFKSGELDITGLTPIQWLKQSDGPEFARANKLKYTAMTYSFIGWNQDGSNPFFTDKRVRKAMTLSLNIPMIIEKIYLGFATQSTGPFYPGTWSYNPNVKPLPYNPEEAKRLLASAGWKDTNGDGYLDKDGVKFEFELLVPGSDIELLRVPTILRESLMSLGIICNIRSLEWSAFVKRVHNHEFQAIIMAFGIGSDPSELKSMWHSKEYEAGNNYIKYQNATVDSLLEQGKLEFNKEKRKKIYHRIHELIYEDQPFTFLIHGVTLIAIDKRFRNVEPSPVGLFLYFPGMRDWYVPKELQKYK